MRGDHHPERVRRHPIREGGRVARAERGPFVVAVAEVSVARGHATEDAVHEDPVDHELGNVQLAPDRLHPSSVRWNRRCARSGNEPRSGPTRRSGSRSRAGAARRPSGRRAADAPTPCIEDPRTPGTGARPRGAPRCDERPRAPCWPRPSGAGPRRARRHRERKASGLRGHPCRQRPDFNLLHRYQRTPGSRFRACARQHGYRPTSFVGRVGRTRARTRRRPEWAAGARGSAGNGMGGGGHPPGTAPPVRLTDGRRSSRAADGSGRRRPSGPRWRARP
jgi:hypothetical protein